MGPWDVILSKRTNAAMCNPSPMTGTLLCHCMSGVTENANHKSMQFKQSDLYSYLLHNVRSEQLETLKPL